jgi:RNA polymerase sigma factor (sigma-70 family)
MHAVTSVSSYDLEMPGRNGQFESAQLATYDLGLTLQRGGVLFRSGGEIGRADQVSHFPLDVSPESVKAAISSDDLLKHTGWEARDGTLVPVEPTRDNLLSSISTHTRSFEKRLSVSGYERDDLVQESFAGVIESLPAYRGKSKLNTWSDRVVKRDLLDMNRASGRDVRKGNGDSTPVCLEGETTEDGDPVGDNEAKLLAGHAGTWDAKKGKGAKAEPTGWNPRNLTSGPNLEEEDRVEGLDDGPLMALVDRVPDGTAAWLYEVEGWPMKDVAEYMGIPFGTAKRRVPRAWEHIQALPEVGRIVRTALRRRMVDE